MTQMVTTCPNCRQQLAVTAADLRVGQGFVRCGRCDKVFNALLTLTESSPSVEVPEGSAHGTMSIPALDEQDILPPLPGHEDEEVESFGPMDDVEVVETLITGEYRRPDAQGSEQEALNLPGTPLAEEIVRQATRQPIDLLLGEDALEADGPAAQEAAPAAVADDASAGSACTAASAISPGNSLPEVDAPAPRPAMQEVAASTPPPPATAVEEDFDAEAALGNPRRRQGWWIAAAVLLALLLAGQYVHHNRHDLVTNPVLAEPIRQVYGWFGRTVDPPWSLAWYEVSGLGASGTAPGATSLVLQAAVAVNKDAGWAQPPPLLRVVLSDQYGNVLTTRQLAPAEWVLGDVPKELAPGERLDAELRLEAPARATSYALYPCLPDATGAVRCTDDPPP
jgi:predicted Zn finger-like uncharacterized protein